MQPKLKIEEKRKYKRRHVGMVDEGKEELYRGDEDNSGEIWALEISFFELRNNSEAVANRARRP